MRPAVEVEHSGLPSVVITSSGFSVLAKLGAKAGGIPGLRIAEYPGTLGTHSPDTIAKNVDAQLLDQVVEGLTRPDALSSTEASAAWNPRRIVCTGTAEEITRAFQENDWTDGLPIVSPTIERVEAFLRMTDDAPDEVIGVLPSANLVATPWNVAVNGVMAGCRPEHMPILLAATQALADDAFSLNNIGSSSGLFPFLVVNGPIVGELGIECRGQLISRGPNPALGRALGLIVRNIAGFRPGKTYMGTYGYPIVMALAENEADSPWTPFHVDQGFEREQSTVTLGVTTNWGSQPEASSGPDNRSVADVALELIQKEIRSKARVYDFPTIGPKAEHVMITVLISPPVAKCLAEAGWSKRTIAEHLHRTTTMSLREFEWITRYTYPASISVADKVKASILPEEFAGPPDKLARILAGPEIVHIIVCGDPNRNRLMVLEGGHTHPTTKLIRRRS